MLPDTNQGNNNNRSILVLDDEPDIATIVKKSLQDLGFRVSAFTDPVVALEYFKSNFKHSCNIVISDIRMPGINGYELIKKAKEIDKQVKVVLMSAFEINEKEFHNPLRGQGSKKKRMMNLAANTRIHGNRHTLHQSNSLI
jgi:CheY-like chemotaxis protein